MLRRFVVGHTSPFTEDGEQIRIARPWGLPRAINPAGGLVSSVRDLLKYARLHLGYGPAGVLSEESRRAMQAPLAQAGNFADSVGVAWMLRSVAGSRIVEHGGGTNGQQTTFKLLPDQPCALIILTNSSRGAELHAELAGWIMREYLGLQDSAPTPIELPTERLHEYVGHYERSTDMIDVNVDRGQLVLQATPKRGFPTKDSPPGPTPPPVHFAFWSEDRIIGLEPPFKDARAEFLRDADNRIVWLRAGGRLTARK